MNHDLDNINTRRDESLLGKLSARTRATLDALMKSPVAEKAIAEAERQTVEMRRALFTELGGLAKTFEPQKQVAEAAAVRAARELDDAEAAHRAAEVTLAQARNACDAVDLRQSARTLSLLRELITTADPRWSDFVRHASNLLDADLPAALLNWPDEEKRRNGRHMFSISSNWTEVEAAREALRAAIGQAKRQQLEPLGYVEVSEALSALCAGLAPSLAVLQLNPPTLSAEHVEVGAPLRWSGKSVWVLDGQYEPTADDRKAKADDTKARLRRQHV